MIVLTAIKNYKIDKENKRETIEKIGEKEAGGEMIARIDIFLETDGINNLEDKINYYGD